MAKGPGRRHSQTTNAAKLHWNSAKRSRVVDTKLSLLVVGIDCRDSVAQIIQKFHSRLARFVDWAQGFQCYRLNKIGSWQRRIFGQFSWRGRLSCCARWRCRRLNIIIIIIIIIIYMQHFLHVYQTGPAWDRRCSLRLKNLEVDLWMSPQRKRCYQRQLVQQVGWNSVNVLCSLQDGH